jgi:hypothetical protein
MSKELSTQATNQLDRNDILYDYAVTIDSIKCNDVISYTNDFNRDFGCASLQLSLNNDNGKYSLSGTNEINLRDEIILIEKFAGATDTFNAFRGFITQRNIAKEVASNNINITCLDYIVKLQDTDIDKNFEATKYLVEDEVLTPNYLTSPNDMYASIFDFANTNIADEPPVSIRIRNKTTQLEDPQWNGFEIQNESGQVTLGAVLNARDNFEIIATYYFYPKGLYAEDIIESILTEKDGYGNYLFNETSTQNVIDNHLTETFFNVEAKVYDTLTCNTEPTTVDIETTLVSACVSGTNSIIVNDATGYPNTNNDTLFSVNGDMATYKCITGSTLYGIPSSGNYALKAHPVGSYVTYTATFPINQIWYLSYDNLVSTMSGSQFTLPVGSTIRYIDKRYGSILLDAPVVSSSDVRCNYNYSFKTLQASGVEITGIKFNEKNEKTRFDALVKLRNLLAPNYVIRTIGDNKIWASYLNQKDTADYELKSIKSINYGEDIDLYTRTVFFGKNSNPHNVLFDTGVAFMDTGETYTATTTNTELSYSADDGAFKVYTSGLQAGKILTDTIVPIVYINNVPIDNNVHEIVQSDILLSTKITTTTETRDGGWSSDPQTTVNTDYLYKVYFSHRGLVASQVVTIYGPTGSILYTLGPNDSNIDYENGIWVVPGSNQNSTTEQSSTASYWIMYSTDDLQIDYSQATFKINHRLIPVPSESLVTATFEYSTVSTPIENATACFDGRWDTQTQTTFYAKPPQGFVYAVLDLGEIKNIQLIDIIAGFFKPDVDGRRKFEMTNYITLQYSYDNNIYYDIASDTTNFALTSGKTKTFDESVLGEDFKTRYFKLVIEDLEKIDYGDNGIYALSLVEISAYNDVVLRGECKLIPTTELTQVYNGESTMFVKNTVSFPSGAGFAYLNSGSGISNSAFWYSGKTSTSFTGVTGSGIGTYAIANKVYDYEETSTSLYDSDYLLDKLQDVVYKNTTVNEYLNTQTKVNERAKNWLKESVKNHTTLDVELMYAPHLLVGNTVSLNDQYNRINQNYFIEKKNSGNNGTQITIARYP